MLCAAEGVFPRLVPVALLVLISALQTVDALVYIKLFPGKELCVAYEGYRDPEEDPPMVDVRHRNLDPRSVNIRTHLYGPNGKKIQLNERIDPFGNPASLFFHVTETGAYRLCMRTPLSHPPIRLEMRFIGEKDLVEQMTTVDGTQVVDKPVETEDYKDRLHMLDICVQVTHEEVRMVENRLHMLDEETHLLYYRVVWMLLFNLILAVGMSVGVERYLERYFTKKKLV